MAFVAFYNSNATNVKLEGSWSYSIDYSEGSVHLTGYRVSNNETSGISGTLKLRIRLTSTEYNGGTIGGTIMAEYTLGQLKGGYYYNNIDQNLKFNAPSTGNYYVTLTLLEYTDDGYIIMDYIKFDNKLAYESSNIEDNLERMNEAIQNYNNILQNYNNNLNHNNSKKQTLCYECHGTGRCIVCHGSGIYSIYGQTNECSACKYHKGYCSRCNGTGYEK
jgi:hypothetical protein